MVAKHVKADIIVTPSNDPRSYRVNSDRLLATGFRPKKPSRMQSRKSSACTRKDSSRTKTAVQSEMDGKGRSEMNTRAFSTPARLSAIIPLV